MIISALIVTYNNRFEYVAKVVERVFSLQIDFVVLINNGSNIQLLREFLSDIYFKKLIILNNSSNEGSASAFKKGLQYISNNLDISHVLLLDDDNFPDQNLLNNLKESYQYYSDKANKDVVLLANRDDRNVYKDAASIGISDLMLGNSDGFLGVDFISRIFHKNKGHVVGGKPLVDAAPYGGIFIPISVVRSVGYPNPDFFVYADDYEWTYRITLSGYEIVFIESAHILDLEPSWNSIGRKGNILSKLKRSSYFQQYYSIRNRIIFEKKYRVKNKLRYFFNLIIFSIIYLFYSIFSKEKIYCYFRAIKDGLKIKTGKTDGI